MVGGGSGVGLMESLVKTGKLSDGEQWVEESDGARKESEEVMTKSRMWLWLWEWIGTHRDPHHQRYEERCM